MASQRSRKIRKRERRRKKKGGRKGGREKREEGGHWCTLPAWGTGTDSQLARVRLTVASMLTEAWSTGGQHLTLTACREPAGFR